MGLEENNILPIHIYIERWLKEEAELVVGAWDGEQGNITANVNI